MRINRAAIKQNAKGVIVTTKPSPILVGLAFLAVTYVLQFLSYTVSGQYQAYTKMMDQMLAGNLDYVPVLPHPNAGGVIIGIAIFLMLMMLSTGFTIYCMNICQFRKAGFGNLLDGFAIFFKVLWLNILMFIFVYLWSLLLIIPGIIAAYRYRMALYIMIDNPQLSALECIRASKQMMTGRKGELFVLDLSFLGWALLTLFPFVTIWVTLIPRLPMSITISR
ncbi:MAG: DUF975 family protein [Oscillospiraceae bacterium]